MNFYLLNLIGKWFNFGLLSLLTILNFNVESKQFGSVNNHNKNTNIVSNIVEHDVIKEYDSSLPIGKNKVIEAGKDGIYFVNNDQNITLENAVSEKIIIGTGMPGEHKGVMTGYGPDCSTCSGIGNVACRTKDKRKFNLIKDDVYYEDEEYGKARVLAADLSYFPCGTIIEVKSSNLGTFTGIVMDTGYTMREKFKQGIFHIDVAYKTEKDKTIRKATNMTGTVEFNVQRWGW